MIKKDEKVVQSSRMSEVCRNTKTQQLKIVVERKRGGSCWFLSFDTGLASVVIPITAVGATFSHSWLSPLTNQKTTVVKTSRQRTNESEEQDKELVWWRQSNNQQTVAVSIWMKVEGAQRSSVPYLWLETTSVISCCSRWFQQLSLQQLMRETADGSQLVHCWISRCSRGWSLKKLWFT